MASSMELHEVRYFLALSRAIPEMEDELGALLFTTSSSSSSTLAWPPMVMPKLREAANAAAVDRSHKSTHRLEPVHLASHLAEG